MRRLLGIILLAFIIYVGYQAYSSPYYSSLIMQYFFPQTNIILQEVSKSRLLSPLLLPYFLQERSINEHLSTKALDPRLEVQQTGEDTITIYLKTEKKPLNFPITLHEYIDVNVFIEGEIQRFKNFNKEIASSKISSDGKFAILGSGCDYSNPCTINLKTIHLGEVTSIKVAVPGGTISQEREEITLGKYTVVSGMIKIKITDADFDYLGEILYRF
jgi:hypothetical protein